MKLLNDFFKIIAVDKLENKFTVHVEINPAHEIFKGHFPGRPVVPGVCMVQILKEIMGEIFHSDFTMKEASQLKYLAILNPLEVNSFSVEISVLDEDANAIKISGVFQQKNLIFLKYKVTFTPLV